MHCARRHPGGLPPTPGTGIIAALKSLRTTSDAARKLDASLTKKNRAGPSRLLHRSCTLIPTRPGRSGSGVWKGEDLMIQFYFRPTPNPAKIALFLEETGLAYEVVPVDTSRGEQHTPEFRAINPNGKVPAIVDTNGPGGRETCVFDSGAILLTSQKRPASFSAHPISAVSSSPGSSTSRPALAPSRGRPCISSAPHLRSCLTPSIAIGARPNATTACLTSTSKGAASSSAPALRSLTSQHRSREIRATGQ